MHMYVYYRKRLIVVETNMKFAIPYWEKRKQKNDSITWEYK